MDVSSSKQIPSNEESELQRILDLHRERLLDLTLRNSLLNFRETGAKVVPILHEQPNILYQILVEKSKTMSLDILPDPVEEQSKGFSKFISSSLPASLLGKKNKYSLHAAPPKEQVAPEFTDSRIQTSLPAREYRKRLSNVRSEYQQFIDSTGSNFLYLSLGFLKWHHPTSSPEKARLAPLLLVPLKIERKAETITLLDEEGNPFETKHWSYQVSYSGEELSDNYTLRKKLETTPELPPINWPTFNGLTDDFTPEQYLAQFSSLIASFPKLKTMGWSVERKLAITFFASGKEVLYRDLEPARWSKKSPLTNKPLIKAALGFGENKPPDQKNDPNAPPDTNIYYIDPIPNVLEIDSTQLKAVEKCLRGQSMVIQGPPGTGKSQTITNLIAAAIGTGKTVLFMAEKPEALKVVGRRLADVGLEPYCLELHSDKATTADFQSQLKSRLACKKPRKPKTREDDLASLETLRSYLDNYGAVLKTPLTNETSPQIFQIFWKREQAYQDLKNTWKEHNLADFSPPSIEPDLFRNEKHFHDLLALSRMIGKSWQEGILELEKVWGNFRPPNRLFENDVSEIRDNFKKGESAILALCKTAENPFFAERQTLTLPQWKKLFDSLSKLPKPPSEWQKNNAAEFGKTIATQTLPIWSEQAADANRNLSKIVATENELAYTLFKKSKATFPENNEELFQQCHQISLTACEEKDLFGTNLIASQDNVTALNELTDSLKHVIVTVSTLREKIDSSNTTNTLTGAYSTQKFAQLLTSQPSTRIANLRPSLFEQAKTNLAIAKAKALAEKLRYEQDPLDQILNLRELERLENPQEFLTHLRGLSLRWWKFPFFGPFAKAKRAAKIIRSNKDIQVLSNEFFQAIEDALAYIPRRNSFQADSLFTEQLGPVFDGIDTDWKELDKSLQCCAHISDHEGEAAPTFLENLQQASTKKNEIPTALLAFETALAPLAENPNLLILGHHEPKQESIPFLLEEIANKRAKLTTSITLAESFELSKETPYKELHQQFNNAVELSEAHDKLLTSAKNVSSNFFASCKSLNLPHSLTLSKTIDWILAIEKKGLNEAEIQKLLTDDDPAKQLNSLGVLAEEFSAARAEQLAALTTLEKKATLRSNSSWSKNPENKPLLGLKQDWHLSAPTYSTLIRWSDYTALEQKLNQEGFVPLLNYCKNHNLNAQSPEQTLSYLYWNELASQIFSNQSSDEAINLSLQNIVSLVLNNPEGLASIGREELEERIARFCKEDVALAKLNQRHILSETFVAKDKLPTGNRQGSVSTYTEMGLLEHEAGKRRRLRPVREQIERAPLAIKELFPCALMNPGAIAKFLPPDSIEFDLIIIDEASQVRPEDALGALARAHQAVVVGDNKQMAPSNFFQATRISPAENEEDIDDHEAAESILEVAERKSYFKKEFLQWHYRSQHQSLIAFSNERYYNNNLIIPPSSYEKNPKLGVEWNHIPEGNFKKGLNRTEADALFSAYTAFIEEQAYASPDTRESIGLVVMNSQQASLIQDKVDRLLLDDPRFSKCYDLYHKDDFPPAFIRNLERVQGDERDVIMVGFTYGPDPETGKIAKRFSNLYGISGARRLNVLITRAKKSMRIYASMKCEQLTGGTPLKGGVRDMADFLAFVENEGETRELGIQRDQSANTPFEASVAAVISTLGFEVDFQVGVSGFFVDIGVRKPGENRYLCGIECDGTTYQAHPITRDRERLRQDILAARGWKIHRLWSTDWFRNRNSEIERLKSALDCITSDKI